MAYQAKPMLPPRAWHAIAGVLIGDFASAFVHFLEDNYLRYHPSHPEWLNRVALGNELHHHFPRLMTGISYWENMKEATLAFSAAALAFFLVARKTFVRYWVAVVAAGLVVSTGNLIHRFQHERDCNRPMLATILMKAGIIQGRSEHRAHHAGVPDNNYGVSLAFTNPVYDTLQVWGFLKALLAAFGVRPCMVSSNIWVEDTEVCPRRLFRRTGAREPEVGDVDVTGLHARLLERLRRIRSKNKCAYYAASPHDYLQHRCEGNQPEFCLEREDEDPRLSISDLEHRQLESGDEGLVRASRLDEC